MSYSNIKYIQYRGYVGSVEVSIEDRCLFGCIKGIKDLVTYSGLTYDILESQFKIAVNEYIDKKNTY